MSNSQSPTSHADKARIQKQEKRNFDAFNNKKKLKLKSVYHQANALALRSRWIQTVHVLRMTQLKRSFCCRSGIFWGEKFVNPDNRPMEFQKEFVMEFVLCVKFFSYAEKKNVWK